MNHLSIDKNRRDEPWIRRLSAWCFVRLFCLWRWSCRIEYRGQVLVDQAKAAHPQGVCAFALYHENLFAGIMCHSHRKLAPLASLSRDGDVVTSVLDRLGYYTIRGSSSRGGEKAREELVDIITAGFMPTITVDGPRGPRRMVKGGIVDVARRTGACVISMTPVASRYWTFTKSWDHFRLPKPFSHIIIQYGEPLFFDSSVSGTAFGDAKRKVKEQLENGEQLILAAFP